MAMTDDRARRAESTAGDDAALVARIVGGDLAAFQQLMRRHNTALFRAARAIVRDDADAEDVLQEAYLAAYRHLQEFRGDARLSTWLTRIVINQALGRLRARRRDNVVALLDDRPPGGAEPMDRGSGRVPGDSGGDGPHPRLPCPGDAARVARRGDGHGDGRGLRLCRGALRPDRRRCVREDAGGRRRQRGAGLTGRPAFGNSGGSALIQRGSHVRIPERTLQVKHFIITVAASSLALLAGSAAAQAPSDAQIASIVVTADQVDIDAGKLAESKGSNAEVKAFGKQMVTDHSGVNKQAVALVTKLKVTPEDNDTSKSLKAGGADNVKNLQTLSGAAFDKAYVDHEVAYHQQVLDAIDKILIPSAQNAELKSLLVSVRPAFVAHLEHAKGLQATLAKKS